MPPPVPGDTVPLYATQSPWNEDQLARLSAAFSVVPTPEAVDDERARFVSPTGELEVYRQSRSFRWKTTVSDAGAEVHSLDPDLALSNQLRGDRAEQVLVELRTPPSGAPVITTSVHTKTEETQMFPRRLDPAADEKTVRFVSGQVSERRVWIDGLPYWNARLRVEINADQRVRAVGLFWNRPEPSGLRVTTLTLAELDHALTEHDLGARRWEAPPVLGYQLGFPHLRQPLLIPVYKLAIAAGRRLVTVTTTAIRLHHHREIPAEATRAFLGDVVLL